MTPKDLEELMSSIIRKEAPSIERPIYWMQGGYTYKNDGEHIYIRMEDDTYEIINENLQ